MREKAMRLWARFTGRKIVACRRCGKLISASTDVIAIVCHTCNERGMRMGDGTAYWDIE